MTDVDVYQPAAIEPYPAGLAMTPQAAKALDDQLTQCINAILREGTDYGVIPGTGGDKSLWRPGAQKLLLWFGLSFTLDQTDLERDGDGRKHGVTYRCTITRRDGSIATVCDGTADYDESKFYQTAEEVQRRAETAERRFAEKDRRPPRPTRWQGLPEYRADWNSVMKRAQKRAIVGATLDATGAGGRFNQDREEDDHAPAPADAGPSWYETALRDASTYTDLDDGRALHADAAQAARDGLCTPKQANHVQNVITKRADRLKAAAGVTDFEDGGTDG